MDHCEQVPLTIDGVGLAFSPIEIKDLFCDRFPDDEDDVYSPIGRRTMQDEKKDEDRLSEAETCVTADPLELNDEPDNWPVQSMPQLVFQAPAHSYCAPWYIAWGRGDWNAGQVVYSQLHMYPSMYQNAGSAQTIYGFAQTFDTTPIHFGGESRDLAPKVYIAIDDNVNDIISVNACDKVVVVKKHIMDAKGIPIFCQQLWLDAIELKNWRTILSYCKSSHYNIRLQMRREMGFPKNPKMEEFLCMAVAAAGRSSMPSWFEIRFSEAVFNIALAAGKDFGLVEATCRIWLEAASMLCVHCVKRECQHATKEGKGCNRTGDRGCRYCHCHATFKPRPRRHEKAKSYKMRNFGLVYQ